MRIARAGSYPKNFFLSRDLVSGRPTRVTFEQEPLRCVLSRHFCAECPAGFHVALILMAFGSFPAPEPPDFEGPREPAADLRAAKKTKGSG